MRSPALLTARLQWWRRREQTLRLAMWMSMNGVTGVVGSLVTYGLGHIHGSLYPYQVRSFLRTWAPWLNLTQIIFLFIGLLTIVCSPIV